MSTRPVGCLSNCFLFVVAVTMGSCSDSASPAADGQVISPDSAVDSIIVDSGLLEAEDGAVVTCTPGTRQCAVDVAEVCVAAGNAWNQLPCPNGCKDGECEPMSLEAGWKTHQYQLTDDSITTPANYTFEDNGLVAFQSANPMASVYYKDMVYSEGIRVTGRFAVETSADDDMIGFVFGWQDPEHYYLLDWKQAYQDSASCGLAEAGATLKRVSSEDEIDKCEDFWSSAGTSRITPIVGFDKNPGGWQDNTFYNIDIIFRPGDITITINDGTTDVVSLTSTDTTYSSGKFGFYNYSQESVRYEFFSISPVQ